MCVTASQMEVQQANTRPGQWASEDRPKCSKRLAFGLWPLLMIELDHFQLVRKTSWYDDVPLNHFLTLQAWQDCYVTSVCILTTVRV